VDFIIVPSKQLLPEMQKAIEEQMKEVILPGNKKLEIKKLEWVEEGLKVWIVK
jgi:hypothetical protein